MDRNWFAHISISFATWVTVAGDVSTQESAEILAVNKTHGAELLALGIPRAGVCVFCHASHTLLHVALVDIIRSRNSLTHTVDEIATTHGLTRALGKCDATISVSSLTSTAASVPPTARRRGAHLCGGGQRTSDVSVDEDAFVARHVFQRFRAFAAHVPVDAAVDARACGCHDAAAAIVTDAKAAAVSLTFLAVASVVAISKHS